MCGAFPQDEDYAIFRDRTDPLSEFQDYFFVPDGMVYLDGNSLGPASVQSEKYLLRSLKEWKEKLIGGWLDARPSWFYYGEKLGDKMAPLVGAEPGEVVVTGSTTVNLHTLLGSFYRPRPGAPVIVADELNFPSDLYALRSHLASRGRDPKRDLRLVSGRDGRTLAERDIIAAMTDEVCLVVLPSVLYRSGQLLDIGLLTERAHERNILIGFDCSHSVGVIPHHFDRWGWILPSGAPINT